MASIRSAHTGKSTKMNLQTVETENPIFKGVNEDVMEEAFRDAYYTLRWDQERPADKCIYEKDPQLCGIYDYRCRHCWTSVIDPFELRGASSGCDRCTQ